MGRKVSILVVVVGIILASCKRNNELPPILEDAPEVLPTRDEVVFDYNNVFLTTDVTTNGWTGNVSSCSPGTISQEAKDNTLARINYFRKLVRVNPVTWNTSLFSKFQKTAVLMQANNTVSHYPPSSWTCYNAEGAEGAREANLSYYSGAHYQAPWAVNGQVEDPGASNYAVGHRRWLFHTKASSFSMGAANSVVVIGILNTGWKNTSSPNFIAYPAKGYFPKPLVYEKWSFGKPNADFSGASVSMTGPDGAIPLTILSKNNLGIGDNTIVWEPKGIDLSRSGDQVYTVTVSGIKNAYKSTYSYNVVLINP